MVVFAHFKQKSLKSFADKLILFNDDYKNRSYDFEFNIKEFFKEMQDYFKQIGDSKHETQVSQLSIYYETAIKGIHPLKLEKLKLGRRENTWIAAFYCLTTLSEILQINIERVEVILKEANEMLSQLILSAIQNQLISQLQLDESDNLNKIEALWNKLKQNQQIGLIHKKLRLTITNNDIYLLLDEIISTLK